MSNRATVVRLIVALAVVGAAYSIGRAQNAVADFEITIDAPVGEVVLTCTKGCAWNQPGAVQKTAFWCKGAAYPPPCSGTVNGRGIVTPTNVYGPTVAPPPAR